MRMQAMCVFAMMMIGSGHAAGAGDEDHRVLRPVPFTKVTITDRFWSPRLEANRTRTLPHDLEYCEQTGRISNFAKAARQMEGKFEGIYFNDSDVYKVLEGAAYTLALHRDKELEARIDAIIDKIAAAQQPDGYLNTYYTLAEPGKRWTNLARMHELYCAGHMFEAAVAYKQATGKDKFLNVARRMADHIDGVFGPGKRVGSPGHEEIELALIKLYHETGEARYRDLAKFFVDVRGTHPIDDKEIKPEYLQSHVPVREQKEITGHAVRAMYLYAGVADVAALTGDAELVAAMDRIWHDVVLRKMYVTGGIGARHEGEAFGEAYELPNESAYCETCAAIGMALWNHRLLVMHGNGRYADVLEQVLYNGALAGVSLDGEKFFYVNPLLSRGKHERQAWYGCACCPTNVVRFLPSIPGYVYAESDEAVWVNLYVAGSGQVTTKAGQVKISQETDYPWSGKVKLSVEPASPAEFSLKLRIPSWCDAAAIRVNGQAADAAPVKGYASILRKWQRGDVVELDLPMEIRRIQAHPKVAANAGRIALQRGPIVFCLEAPDNNGRVLNLALPRDAELRVESRPDLLGGVVTIKAKGLAPAAMDWKDKLYQPMGRAEPAEMTAIPYYSWANRAIGEMTVWIPESVGLAEP